MSTTDLLAKELESFRLEIAAATNGGQEKESNQYSSDLIFTAIKAQETGKSPEFIQFIIDQIAIEQAHDLAVSREFDDRQQAAGIHGTEHARTFDQQPLITPSMDTKPPIGYGQSRIDENEADVPPNTPWPNAPRKLTRESSVLESDLPSYELFPPTPSALTRTCLNCEDAILPGDRSQIKGYCEICEPLVLEAETDDENKENRDPLSDY